MSDDEEEADIDVEEIDAEKVGAGGP